MAAPEARQADQAVTDPIPRNRRNPRRAYTREGREITPATVGAELAEGRDTVWICCEACQHSLSMGIRGLPPDWALPDLPLELRLVCRECGSKAIAATIDVTPIYARERAYRSDQPVTETSQGRVVPWQGIVGPERAQTLQAGSRSAPPVDDR